MWLVFFFKFRWNPECRIQFYDSKDDEWDKPCRTRGCVEQHHSCCHHKHNDTYCLLSVQSTQDDILGFRVSFQQSSSSEHHRSCCKDIGCATPACNPDGCANDDQNLSQIGQIHYQSILHLLSRTHPHRQSSYNTFHELPASQLPDHS